MPLLKWLARQLSLDNGEGNRRRNQQEAQQSYPPPVLVPWPPGSQQPPPAQHPAWQPTQQQQRAAQPTARQLQRQQEKAAAKAAAQAAAAGRPKQRPPRGPCGERCNPPSGGTTTPLPLAAALVKNRPPWNTRRLSDTSLAQLWAGGADAVRVRYPAGSGPPSSGLRGGIQLGGAPACLPARDCLLRFDFCVPPDFNWTRGGKLGGGLQIGSGAASGYRHSATAASARATWGPDGAIQLYVYTMERTQQAPEYGQVAKLGQGCGDHLFPGTFQVQRGVWNTVLLRVRLNTPGQPDGVAGLGVNGGYVEYRKMAWRARPETLITEVMLVTFFGGSWTTPVDMHIDFANFSLTVLE
ncbi:hypothetical protein ABPG75_013818 [Micractinium tetrahymenae]